jgi:hypothetical protein
MSSVNLQNLPGVTLTTTTTTGNISGNGTTGGNPYWQGVASPTTVQAWPPGNYQYAPTWNPNWTTTIPVDNSAVEVAQLRKDMKDVKKMLGLILEGDENPALLEKYKNLKKAYDEYCFFRDLILDGDEKKSSQL